MNRWAWALLALVPLAFLTLFFLWPTAALVMRGFHDGSGWSLAGFEAVFSQPRTWRIIGFTLGMATLATLVCVLLGVPGAYALYRCRFPGQGFCRAVVAVPFVLPTVVVGVAFGTLFDRGGPLGFLGLDDHWLAILLGMVFFNYTVIVRMTGTVWARLDPQLPQAAATLGASPWRALRTVTLPALAPAIGAAAGLVFLFCSTAFGIVMVLGGVRHQTVESEIWYRTTQLLDLQGAAALSVVQLLVVALSLTAVEVLQRRTTGRLHLLPVPSATPMVWRRDRWSLIVTAVVVLGLLVLPMANLVLRSLRHRDAWGLGNYRALFQPGTRTTVPVHQALWNSVWIAAVAAAIALVLGMLVALLVTRRPRTRRGRVVLTAVEGAVVLPLGVSAVTVGFGYLITLNRPPLDLRSSLALVPIAQAVVALPLVVRSLTPGLRAVPGGELEASATLGAGPWHTLRRIELPRLLAGLGLAAGFAYASSLGEFGATSFLSRPDNPTLPVLIFRLFGRPGADNYGTALAAAVVLAALTAIVMGVAERVRGEGVATW